MCGGSVWCKGRLNVWEEGDDKVSMSGISFVMLCMEEQLRSGSWKLEEGRKVVWRLDEVWGM